MGLSTETALSVLPPPMEGPVTLLVAVAFEEEAALIVALGAGLATGFVPDFAEDLAAGFAAVLAAGLVAGFGAVALGMAILMLAAGPVAGVVRANAQTLPVYPMNCLLGGNKKAAIAAVLLRNGARIVCMHAPCNMARS
jgi:hypothetical protein